MPSSAPIASSSFSPGITALSRLDATKASSRNVLSVPARKRISVPLLACAVRKAASRSDGVDWYWSVAGSLTVVMATRCVLLSDGSVTGAWIWNGRWWRPTGPRRLPLSPLRAAAQARRGVEGLFLHGHLLARHLPRFARAPARDAAPPRAWEAAAPPHPRQGVSAGAPPPSEGRAVDRVSLTLFQSSPVVWLMTPK